MHGVSCHGGRTVGYGQRRDGRHQMRGQTESGPQLDEHKQDVHISKPGSWEKREEPSTVAQCY